MQGFALMDAVIGLAICVIALGAFYAAAGQSVRMVRHARERALASQLLEQRLEEFRTRPKWTEVVGPAGLKEVAGKTASPGALLPQASERYSVGPSPGESVAYTVSRDAEGRISVTGSALAIAQTSVRVTATVQWGGPGEARKSRTVATILTKGGL